MNQRCLFNAGSTRKTIALLAFCAVVWCVVGLTILYESVTRPDAPVFSESTYKPESLISSTKIKAGVYVAKVVQPFTVFNKVEYVQITYRITSAVDGSGWIATRSVVMNGRKLEIGADAFRTKRDALEYITMTGRHIDYGKSVTVALRGIK